MSGQLNSEQTSNWLTASTIHDAFQIDTHFSTTPKKYVEYIPAKTVQKGRLNGTYVDLPSLPFNTKNSATVSVKTIIGHENAYGAYLRALIEHSFLDKKPFKGILTETIISTPDGSLNFWLPLRSNSLCAKKFTSDILSGKIGTVLFFEYQDGVVVGEIKNEFIHFLDTPYEFDADYELDELDYNISFPLKEFQVKFAENQRLVRNLIVELTNEIGVDVWSNPLEKTPNFKTETWHPKKPIMIDEKDHLKRFARNFYRKFF